MKAYKCDGCYDLYTEDEEEDVRDARTVVVYTDQPRVISERLNLCHKCQRQIEEIFASAQEFDKKYKQLREKRNDGCLQ